MKKPVKTSKPDRSKAVHDYPLLMLQAIGFLPLILILSYIFWGCMKVYAVRLPESYEIWWRASESDYNGKYYQYSYKIGNANPMFIVHFEPSNDTDDKASGMYFLCEYDTEEKKARQMGGSTTQGQPISGFRGQYNADGELLQEWVWDSTEPDKYLGNFYSVTLRGEPSFACSVYIFDSMASGEAYYKSGDKSGILYTPEPDYDYDHDFREDVYDPDIPVPELSNLSHNGFHVNNADPSRDIEIYMTSTFYGVKHNKNIAINFDADTSWKFNTHRYNLINTDISYSDADINIKEKFNADNVNALISDFQQWSHEYPSHDKLPDCKTFRHQPDEDYNIDYKWYHTYGGGSGKDPEAMLHDSKQASTTYYVRFCQYVPGEGYTWGKWVSYTYTPAGYGQKDNVIIGDVEFDPDTGNPTTTNPTPGKQDPSTGDTDYSGTVNIDSSDLWATIKNLVNDMGAIPEIIGEVLSFLPSWVLYMIAASIAACVILRFVGR